MAYNRFSREGQSFYWLISTPFNDEPYTSPVFDIFGTNSKFMLSITNFYKHKEPHFSIQLFKCQRNYTFCNSITILTSYDDIEHSSKAICSSKTLYFPYYPVNDILSAKKPTHINTVEVRCTFFISPDPKKYDISPQVSIECFERQNQLQFMEDNFSLKKPESSLNFFSHLESLSDDLSDMFHKSIATDIELKCREISIPAHRAVLMSRSKVFSAMLKNDVVESNTSSIDVTNIESSILYEFLKFLYSGKIPDGLPAEVILELYKASDKYAVQSLQEGCRNILVRNLTRENCIEILTLGEEHCDQQLKDVISKFIIERPDVLKSDAWIAFEDNFPKLAITIYKKCLAKTS